MASIKDLKKRIGTVKNTQQTTRAMKMVSAAKLRRAQEAIQNQRPYAKAVGGLIPLLASMPGSRIESPLVRKAGDESLGDASGAKSVLLVVMTSDRGLCGGFNGNIIKSVQRWLKSKSSEYQTIDLAFVGKRGFDFFKTKKVGMGPYFSELSGKVTYAKAKKLSDQLVELYLSGKYTEVKVIYNEFKNAVTQKVTLEDFLPLDAAGIQGQESQAELTDFIVKPSPTAVLSSLLSKHFAIQAFRMMLDSQASEHGARMSAMENATNNAADMIRQLTLDYNKQRQAGITKELLEIIAGSESQKAG